MEHEGADISEVLGTHEETCPYDDVLDHTPVVGKGADISEGLV